MAKSSELSPEDPIVYTQYNDLRDDVLDPNTGHTHSGDADDGARISYVNKLNVGAGVSGAADGQVLFSGYLKRTTDGAYPVMGRQGNLRIEALSLLHSDNNVAENEWKSVSETVTFESAFSQIFSVVASVAQVENIKDISNVRLDSVATSGVKVKFKWQSSQGSAWNRTRIYVIAIGI